MPLTPISFTRFEERKADSPALEGSDGGQLDEPIHLLQLQDDLARSRRREAFWISVVVHILTIIAVIAAPKYLPDSRAVRLRTAREMAANRDYTFLELPPDIQKVTRRPKTDIASDKDRIASSKNPTLDRKQLDKLLDARRPGAPTPPGAAAPKPEPKPGGTPAPSVAEARASEARPTDTKPAQPANDESKAPRFESLADAAKRVMGGGLTASLSAGAAIQEAARASAASRGGGGNAGDYGTFAGNSGGVKSNIDILSDTMGVDFGPYLARVLHDVRMNWYNLIPEVARAPLMKKGNVSIEFAITKKGEVAGMRLVSPSGDVSLDRAAWGGITGSNPFPPLPSEYNGGYLALRFHFFYNPDKGEMR
jgi:TonB family protein